MARNIKGSGAADFTQFDCTVCHGEASMAEHHSGVQDYVWESNACYTCHPRGRH